MNELALFAGAGGGILGRKLLGWRTICAVEWEPFPASVLCARQNDGFLPAFPIWDDVQTFDGKPWRGLVDVVSGGFPCQDISSAGKGAGIDGERSGMWSHMARIICEVQPRYTFVENSPLLTKRGLSRVLGDLASMGYDAKWGVLGAADVGANHKRDRIWIVGKLANSSQLQCNGGNNNSGIRLECQKEAESGDDCWNDPISNANLSQQQRRCLSVRICKKNPYARNSCWWKTEPNVGRVADGMAAGLYRLKAIGNGQVPLCAATAWKLLTQKL